MAVAVVLDTNELLEAILMELPINRLLHAQRVCVTWMQTIERSVKLQQALFMRPIGPALTDFMDRKSQALVRAASPQANLYEVLHGHRLGLNIFTHWAIDANAEIAVVPLLNPLLPLYKDYTRSYSIMRPNRSDGQGGSPRLSWERMLLTQPPIKSILASYGNLKHNLISLTPQALTYETAPTQLPQITNEYGVTLGDIMTYLNDELPRGAILEFHALMPITGCYWRKVDARATSAALLQSHIRRYKWEDPRESPIGWDPVEDSVDINGMMKASKAELLRGLRSEYTVRETHIFAGGRAGPFAEERSAV